MRSSLCLGLMALICDNGNDNMIFIDMEKRRLLSNVFESKREFVENNYFRNEKRSTILSK